ncbi:MAG: hypothetical protein LBS33_04045 [Streptococcaceae bacterium]|jgi:cytoskeletal protein RodZ|nr:hypothetical protein [Streptococcaceae bacterium]
MITIAEDTEVKEIVEEQEEKKKKRRFLLYLWWLVALIVIFSALLAGTYYVQHDNTLPTSFAQLFGRDVEADPSAEDKAKKSEASQSKGIEISGYPEVHITAGSTEMAIPLENPKGNPCYFKYTLKLADTDEVLYESGDIAPGKFVNTQTLSRPLEKGEYDAVFEVRTLSLSEPHVAMNGVNLKTKLIVE